MDCREDFDIDLELKHLPTDGELTLKHLRIDSDHSNAYAEWVRQGMSNYPDNGQREAIVRRSGLEYAEAPKTMKAEGRTLKHRFTLPTHGISLLEIIKV